MATIRGTPRDDRLAGTDAADVVRARGGDDRVLGAGGGDALFGEAGDDAIWGDAGSDLIDGGPGADAAFFGSATAPVAVDLARGRAESGGDADRLVGIESVNAGRFDDVVRLSDLDQSGFGRAGDDLIDGRAGDDFLVGGSGADRLLGGVGADNLSYLDDGFDEAGPGARGVAADLAAGRATDNWGDVDVFSGFEGLFGSGLPDLLRGDGRGNFVFGEAGGDVLEGRGGADILDGGDGGDRFVYAAAGDSGPGGADRVADFEPPGRGGRGGDRIDVSAIDADATRAGNQAFAFVGRGPADAPGELRVAAAAGGGALVEASTDRDADPELVVRLADVDVAALTAEAFAL